MKIWTLIFALMLSCCAVAQESSPALSGSWTATVGAGKVFRGTWSAETSPQNSNAARGSWTLLNEAGEVVLQGTWSARKAGAGWQGAWTARLMRGQPLSGTWTADAESLNAKSFGEM